MVKILAIGNSFSQDALYYVHETAKASGVEVKAANLYIGGCSLEQHWRNAETEEKVYVPECNGQTFNEERISLKEGILSDDWDIITLQQASGDSGWQDSYEPFFGLLLEYVKKLAPKAKIYIHKTWAYDEGSDHCFFMRYNRSQEEMYQRLSVAYGEMVEKYKLPVIRSGDLVQKLRSTPPFTPCVGENSVCRDGFHMHFLYGRYAIACLWLRTLLGISVLDNTYIPKTEFFDGEADLEKLAVIRQTVENLTL